MSAATLLAMPDDPVGLATFAFEHAMSHRTYLGAMAPLTRFSVLPYFIHPMQNDPSWRLDHQQAQNDFTSTMPTWGNPPPVPPAPGTLSVAVPLAHNLLDLPNLDDPGQRSWWTFVNHQEHYIASANLPGLLTYPFW